MDNEAAAEVDLRAILASNPNHPATPQRLRLRHVQNPARLAEAQGYVELALKLAPDDLSILDSLGWIYLQQGKIADALKLLKQSLQPPARPRNWRPPGRGPLAQGR